jgi:RNA polymerase sigma-70 factor (ECF subfamily)
MSNMVVDGFALLPSTTGDARRRDDAHARPSSSRVPPEQTATSSDADLLRLSAGGDKAAFGELYDRFSRPLYSLAMKVVGNSAEAEDLVQEVFVELWEKAGDFDASRAQPFTWAVSIIRNKSIDRLRSRTRRGAIVDRSGEDIADRAMGLTASDARESAWFNESADLIREAFTDLPEEQRTAIELAYFEGLSQSEIADRLAQPLGTIKARIRRGLSRLRDRLAGRI